MRPSSATNGIDDAESTGNIRVGSLQKPPTRINRPLSNSAHAIPPIPPPVKSSVSTTTMIAPRKNGEARHTLLAREPISIPIERVAAVSHSQPNALELHDNASKKLHVDKEGLSTRDRRQRSRTLEAQQMQAVDNQIYGCPPSTKPQIQLRSESGKVRSQRLIARRSSEDHQEKQLQLKRSHEHCGGSTQNLLQETWFDIGQEHWTNLLENGWRPTADTPGVKTIAISDAGKIALAVARMFEGSSADFLDTPHSRGNKPENSHGMKIDRYEQVSRAEYLALFEQLDFAYARTINLGNEFWRFLEINGNHHLCLYHQLNKQFIMYKPDSSLLSFPWPYDGIVDISWSKTNNMWAVATQTQIVSLTIIEDTISRRRFSFRSFAIVRSVKFFNRSRSKVIGQNVSPPVNRPYSTRLN